MRTTSFLNSYVSLHTCSTVTISRINPLLVVALLHCVCFTYHQSYQKKKICILSKKNKHWDNPYCWRKFMELVTTIESGHWFNSWLVCAVVFHSEKINTSKENTLLYFFAFFFRKYIETKNGLFEKGFLTIIVLFFG